MPVDPKDFFREYVMDAHDDWVNHNELCKWKAFAVANGLNALVEHAFIEKEPHNSPMSATYNEKVAQTALEKFRENLTDAEDHRRIRFLVESYKHVVRRKKSQMPRTLDDIDIQPAGAFGPGFGPGFDRVRDQLCFEYKWGSNPSSEWFTVREVAERCIASWKTYFNMVRHP
jgi:hypothetical protein